MTRPLLAYVLGALCAWLVAQAAFVAHRNREFTARELETARRAAVALAEGRAPETATLIAGIVEPPQRSVKHPYLAQRRLAQAAGTRPLGGPSAPPEDKLLADAATLAERDGASVRFLSDGSGRLVAAQPAPGGIAVVISRPSSAPAPYPLLPFAGALLLGALVAWGAARLVRPWPSVGTGLGVALMIPVAAPWGGVPVAAALAALAVGVALADSAGTIGRAAHGFRKNRVAYTYLLPAAAGMAILVLAPFAIGCALGFYDHARGEWHYVGLKNFAAILDGDGRSLTDPLNFWFTLGVTVAWTVLNVVLHVVLGVILALALRERWLRARGLFRVLLILPWAVPNYITALIWRGMFQSQFGAVNALLGALGLSGVSWFSHFSTSFTANVVTNTWLGFPFMMVVALGALESIPRDLYEAAAVDGASAWSRFRHITLPMLRPALMPAVVLGSVWTFNMFNVIYLVSAGKPAGATDILVTQAYRWAFERGQRYGMAAAYATLIFLILLGATTLGKRLGRAKEVA